MNQKDNSNQMYSHSTNTLYSKKGYKFQKKKYLPKIKHIKNYFRKDWQNKKILDVGVGYGFLLHLLEKEFKCNNLYGMDPFPKSIKIAEQFTSAIIKHGNIEDAKWPFKEKFDVITCFDVVEHLKNPELFFINARKYLNKKGIILISTPNKQLPYLMRSLPIIGVPDGNPTHINVKRPGYWIKLAKTEDYKILKKWKGENLTHVRFFPEVLNRLCKFLKVDHRKIPILNSFEQAFCMVIKLKK